MKIPTWELATGVTLVGMGVGFRIVAWPIVPIVLPATIGQAPVSEGAPAPSGADSFATIAIDRDPFRLTRRPALTPFVLARLGQPEAPPVPKPALTLVGVVWEGGENPTALVTGFPGVDGTRVVRTGDLVGGLRVREIRSTGVRITGLDTVWVLHLREPGP